MIHISLKIVKYNTGISCGEPFSHKRHHVRFPVNLPAHLEVFRVHTPHIRERGEARVENFSLGGAFLSRIRMENGILPGDSFRFMLSFNLHPLTNWRSECEVTRLQMNVFLSAGIRFINLSDSDRNKLAAIAL